MNVSVTVEGEKLNRALDGLVQKLRDARKPLRAGMREGVRAARENITSRGRAYGHPYRPHAPATLRKIRSVNMRGVRSAGELLNATGRLLRSLTFGGPDSRLEESAMEATFASLVPYAGFHQTGTRHMPQRPIFPEDSPRFEREVGRAMRASYKEELQPLGFDYEESEGAVF